MPLACLKRCKIFVWYLRVVPTFGLYHGLLPMFTATAITSELFLTILESLMFSRLFTHFRK